MNGSTKIIFAICLHLILSFSGFGSNRSIDLQVKQINLPGDIIPSGINMVYPDAAGFIWLATTKGLYRWDGLRAVHFGLIDETETRNITAITQDLTGLIWVGCDDGGVAYVLGRQLTKWKEGDTSAFTRITDMLFDGAGNLWWGTNGSGLLLFDGDKTTNISSKDGLPDDYIYNIEKGFTDEIWASTDRGVAVCKSWEGIFEISSLGREDGLEDDIVRVVRKDKLGKMWMGFHDGGVCFYENTSGKFNQVIPPNEMDFGQINDVVIERAGMWIADKKNGLLFSEGTENPIFSKVHLHGEYLPAHIKSVCTDKMGNLWILGKDGLFVSNGGAYARIGKVGNIELPKMNAVVSLDQNEFWIATDHSILHINAEESVHFLDDLIEPNVKITSMEQGPEGNLWIGTFGQGVIIFNPSTEKYRLISEQDGLINNNVLDISIQNNTVWVATLGGASRVQVNGDSRNYSFDLSSFDREHGLGNNFIYNILQDSKGNVWFGTDGNGLVKYDQTDFQIYDESSGLADDVVYSIVEDSDGDLWFSTATSGIYKFDGSSFYNYTTTEGLSNNNILSLASKEHFVFILTESGLDIFNKKTRKFTSLTEELGIRRIDADLNSVFIGNKKIYFATHNGIIQIDIDRLLNLSLEPLTVLDRVLVNLKTLDGLAIPSLGSDENQLVFEYAGLWYLAPEKVHYLTKLNGYDPTWNTTYDRRASYASLGSGEYSFGVTAYLNQAPAEANAETIQFEILKPVYLRWWFVVLTVFILIAALFWLIKFRERRLKTFEARKKEKLEFEFQTLKNQINPHFLFNSFSTLISMIEDHQEVAVEYTEKLSDFFRDILEVKDQELIPVTEEIRLIKNYYYIQQKRFGNQLKLNIDLDNQVLNSSIPPMSLQLLTENAIKHNVIAKGITLTVNINNDDRYIVVKNNINTKKTVEPSMGIGLQNIRDRYRLIAQKEVMVEEHKNLFIVMLPIIRS